MKKKSLIKRLTVCAMALAMSFTGLFAGCGGGGDSIVIDLGSLMPTANTTPTADNPEVIQASKYIMQEYLDMKGYGDDYFQWAKEYGRDNGASLEQMTSWYNNQINAGNCPTIAMTSLNMFQDLGYYVVLDEYLERVNPYYGDGTTKWKDTFKDEVWKDSSIRNRKGEIIAIPLVLGVGSLTGTFYNKKQFTNNKWKVPTEWSQFTKLMDQAKSKGLRSYQPYAGEQKPTLFSWTMMYSLNINMLKWMGTTAAKAGGFYIDYNEDGELTDLEVLRGVYEGKFNPVKAGPAQSLYAECVDFYSNSMETGWQSYDFTTNWNGGSLVMYSRGLWDIPVENSNNARKSSGQFDYGIFPNPIAGTATFPKYCVDVEYYNKFEDVPSPVSVALNLMKPAIINEDGTYDQEKIEKAIDLLMWFTAKNNNERMAQEKGGVTGSVKGTTYNKGAIDGVDADQSKNLNWTSNKFPVISYNATWPTGYTTEWSGKMNDAFAKIVAGTKGYTMAKFYEDINNYQQNGVDAIIDRMDIDTTGWVRG